MKVTGAVLIVMALPDLVQAISNFIYIKSYGPAWTQGQIAYVQGLSALVKLIIIEPYIFNPLPGARFMELRLR